MYYIASNEWIHKYFDNCSGKIMSFVIKGDSVLIKYNEIWNMIKGLMGKKVHSKPICDNKYIKAKVKSFNGMIHTNF